jgi:hypothetical protein
MTNSMSRSSERCKPSASGRIPSPAPLSPKISQIQKESTLSTTDINDVNCLTPLSLSLSLSLSLISKIGLGLGIRLGLAQGSLTIGKQTVYAIPV